MKEDFISENIKTFNEFMEEESCLYLKIKMSYKLEKQMKKMWGKHQAFNISLGSKLLKLIRKDYN